MKSFQLWCSVLAVLGLSAAACNQADRRADVGAAAAEVKTAAAIAGDQLADGWLTTKIQAQFFADKDIKGRYVNVSTHDGVVTLTGRVEDANAREQALAIAKSTDGVTRVVNQLAIGPLSGARGVPEQIDSAWITTKIQARYFVDRDVNGRNVHVTADNGVVTLYGRVQNEGERAKAIAIARETSGVSHVDDRLVAQPSSSTPGAVPTAGTVVAGAADRAVEFLDDARITSAIQAKFFLDDAIKGRRITVNTHDGVVALHGEVSSEAERAQALLLARTTAGVERVEDSLTIGATEP